MDKITSDMKSVEQIVRIEKELLMPAHTIHIHDLLWYMKREWILWHNSVYDGLLVELLEKYDLPHNINAQTNETIDYLYYIMFKKYE